MTRTNALKTMRLSAEYRTNLALMEKSPLCRSALVKKAREQSALYLARTNFIYPPVFRELGLYEGMPLPMRKAALHVKESSYEETEGTRDFQDMLAVAGKKQIKQNWIWRIGQECLEKSHEGWYGFFITLTVDPKKISDSQAMWEKGVEFRKYLRKLARCAAKACGMPNAIKEGASVRDFVHHVGVIEHGKSRHHHHMHLLLWMRDIPASWKVCPNRGIREPQYRVNDWCRPMATFWPHSTAGIGRPKFFRHEGDMWSKHQFVLPYDRNKKRIVRIHAPEKAGLYIAKYMDKDDKVWLHRIKATRNLGLSRIKKVLGRMHWRKVEALTWRPRTYSLSTLATTIHSCPSGLLRLIAKQETFVRKWENNSLDWEMLLQRNCEPFSGMLQSVRDGDNPRRMRSSQFYEWVTKHLPVPQGYCEHRYKKAITSLGVDFKPVNFKPVNHIGVT